MAKPVVWKIDAARVEMQAIARDIAAAFNVPEPDVVQPEDRRGADWELQIERLDVWTVAGAAELAVGIDAHFAHLYLRFREPSRAGEFDDGCGRLNHTSGKWNRIMTPDTWANKGKPCPATSLGVFRAELRRDFRKISNPNPDPAEVAAWRAKVAASAVPKTS